MSEGRSNSSLPSRSRGESQTGARLRIPCDLLLTAERITFCGLHYEWLFLARILATAAQGIAVPRWPHPFFDQGCVLWQSGRGIEELQVTVHIGMWMCGPSRQNLLEDVAVDALGQFGEPQR